MKNKFFRSSINTPSYFAWWTCIPKPNSKHSQNGWDSFFSFWLGLNILPMSCVRIRSLTNIRLHLPWIFESWLINSFFFSFKRQKYKHLISNFNCKTLILSIRIKWVEEERKNKKSNPTFLYDPGGNLDEM